MDVINPCLLDLFHFFLEEEHAEDPPVQSNSQAVNSCSMIFFDNFLQSNHTSNFAINCEILVESGLLDFKHLTSEIASESALEMQTKNESKQDSIPGHH